MKKFLILIALVSLLVFLATAKAGLIGEDPIHLKVIGKQGGNFTVDEYKFSRNQVPAKVVGCKKIEDTSYFWLRLTTGRPFSTTPSSRFWCFYAEDLLAAAQFPAAPVLGTTRIAMPTMLTDSLTS